MTKVEQLIEQLQQLSPQEWAEFSAWFHDFEWQIWDARLEQDVQAGKLDECARKARADYAMRKK